MAYATGSGSWDSMTPNPYPAYDVTQTDVTSEFVRKLVLNKQYVTPDDAGEIVTDRGNFAFSVSPTEHLYVKSTLEPSEYNTQTIREFGLFLGTVPSGGNTTSQTFLTPAQISSKGTLIVARRIAKIIRASTTRQLAELVITF